MPENARLTDREYEILTALVDLGRYARVARMMDITTQSVKNHMSAIRDKVGIATNVQVAYRLGTGDLDDWLP